MTVMHLSSSDNVVAWSGVEWEDVTCGMTILCDSRTKGVDMLHFAPHSVRRGLATHF